MHEFSLIEALVEAVETERKSCPGTRVRSVRIRVGELRQVEPSTLEFCWDAATQDTPLDGTTLRIERVDARARCPECRAEFAVRENWFECPACHALGGEILAGRELSLVSLELETPGFVNKTDAGDPPPSFPHP
ncbi:MAG: hydrogenase maturation nickel metallochaperone HypA [Verrucomicrobiae bacterium]|nr:hydrogenase maturation nickel metallochaperone HypA [Verrucomicrobiae bacterium]